MNQILVSEKVYVTPELKRRKHIYRLEFFISIFLICLLFSHYIYAQYDRSKGEQVLEEIKAQFKYDVEDTTIKKQDENDVMIVVLNKEKEDDGTDIAILPEDRELDREVYTSTDNVKYSIDSRLQIPKIGLDYLVLSATSPDLLNVSLNKFFGPNGPNGIGNYCIVGHYYTSNKMFGYLHKLQKGDTAKLTDLTHESKETVEYEIYDIYVVEPTDTKCTSQLTGGSREMTLITCTNHGKQRLVLKLREVE